MHLCAQLQSANHWICFVNITLYFVYSFVFGYFILAGTALSDSITIRVGPACVRVCVCPWFHCPTGLNLESSNFGGTKIMVVAINISNQH